MNQNIATSLLNKIKTRKASIGVIGMGYVGLPLAIEAVKAGFSVMGFDIDETKVNRINKGEQYIKHISTESMRLIAKDNKSGATTDFSKIKSMDCIIICVPTPLTKQREPDISYIKTTVETIARYCRKGQLIVLESTTYPGTTREVILPAIESKGLKAGIDFFLAFSPEREDPGNKDFSTHTIVKVVGGYSQNCLKIARKMYNAFVCGTVAVSSTDAAEATKLLENIFRSVNIALVNELKVVFERMGIDIWEVINAAKTKPFGYMPFYPGPGLGGHCIPIDPFYLTWKAREYDCSTRFIELAGEVNTSMPNYVINRLSWGLNQVSKSIKGSKVLIIGVAYKNDIEDDRESPSLRLIELLKNSGANVNYHDPHVPTLKKSRKYNFSMKSLPLTPARLKSYDAVLIATAHSSVDYQLIGKHAKIIVDTRNRMEQEGHVKAKVIRA